ncbi:AAA family ATPase [Planomonospora corallina]|uniref:AAA family ATPase n=1 Tax=Planomonospora corallina TaxID=1806052 RepID=A0ABV8IA19_9ACTN
MIIAVEGTSCVGKSTLAEALAGRFGWEAIGCYYHVADDPAVLGEPVATCEAQQLEALAAHLAVETERARRARAALARDGAVIVDRSVDTLLAHLGAIGHLHGLDARTRARAMVAAQVTAGTAVLPDLTLLLTADPAVLAARAATRPGLPAIYYDPRFAAHFNAHFTDPVSRRCVRVDGGLDRGEVLEEALAHIMRAAVTLAGAR